jgi:site-specific recombinase XerD
VENGTSHQYLVLSPQIQNDAEWSPAGLYSDHDQRHVQEAQWLPTACRMKGNGNEARQLNLYLDTLTGKVLKLERELVQDGKPITIDSFREKWLGLADKPRMLLELFQQHNDQIAALIQVGQDFAPGTLERYKTARDHTLSFLQWKYKINDIDIKRLDFEFASQFEFWLKTVRRCNHNTTMKYIGNLKKIINSCIKKGWLQKDPFLGFKMTKQEVYRVALTEEDLRVISARQFGSERLNHVKDIFLFCCFTGLAYADVKKLKRTEISRGIDGEYWIFTNRQKTDTRSRIPLLPQAIAIMEKYRDYPTCENSGLVLPVLSNQKMNAYLQEIGDLCEIGKHLTFHIARHTFATTVTLSNGVPIESVSMMLGHRNLKTTEHYAKVLDGKISHDMLLLKKKFGASRQGNLGDV